MLSGTDRYRLFVPPAEEHITVDLNNEKIVLPRCFLNGVVEERIEEVACSYELITVERTKHTSATYGRPL